MELIQYKRDTKPALHSDFVFDNLKDFRKIEPALYPKIEGEWVISLMDLRVQEVRDLIKEKPKEYIKVYCFIKQDALDVLRLEVPKLQAKNKSRWDMYLEAIAEYPKLMDVNAGRELYKRTSGNPEKIKEVLQELLLLFEEEETITVKHLDAVTLPRETVYAKDVLLSFFLYSNTRVPSKGSMLSRYKYLKPWTQYDILVNELGDKGTFYSLRKSIRTLYNEKCDYLRGKDAKDKEFMQTIDAFELAHALILFELGNPAQTSYILETIERRDLGDDSLFKRTLYTNPHKYFGASEGW